MNGRLLGDLLTEGGGIEGTLGFPADCRARLAAHHVVGGKKTARPPILPTSRDADSPSVQPARDYQRCTRP